jgi:hypothetical protein
MQSLQTDTAALTALREKLRRHVEQSEGVRLALATRITTSDDAAICALRDPSLWLIYMGGLSKQILIELDAECEDEQEQEEALTYFVRKHERWLEDWNPSTGSGPVMIVHLGAEYEAVKALLRLLREALNPKSKPSETGKPKKQTNTGKGNQS